MSVTRSDTIVGNIIAQNALIVKNVFCELKGANVPVGSMNGGADLSNVRFNGIAARLLVSLNNASTSGSPLTTPSVLLEG